MKFRCFYGLAAATALLAAGGCGSSSSSPPPINVQAARVYHLSGFRPTAPVAAGKPTTLAFTIVQPSGQPLTAYRHGPGPHTGVHLIVVRRDLAVIIHHHPPVAPDGRITDTITFPAPGPYKVVIDAYPQTSGPQRNFQLFSTVSVAGAYKRQGLPPFRASETVDGYHFVLHGRPALHAIQPAFLHFSVTTPNGTPAAFTPWYGALAHAIFFRAGSLDYFHTHVCAPGASGCTSILGGAKVTGSSQAPGKLTVGVLVPIAGTWKLFLQCQVNRQILTAPFTLRVS